MVSAIISRLKSLDANAIIERMGRSPMPWLWIALIVFVFVVPAIVLRGAHFEEGSVISMARGAFEDGHWFDPHRNGNRFVERPALLSWLLAAIGLLTGSVPIWLARLPVALALLGGGWLVYYLVRKHSSPSAALFGAFCFLASPSVLQKVVTAETDIVVASLLFAAFVVHWDGEERGGGTVWRWITVGLVLAIAALVKGPQPLGYFFLGFGAFYLLRRRFIDLIKLGFLGLIPLAILLAWYAGVYQPGDESEWARHSRAHAVPPIEWIYGTLRFFVLIAFLWLPGWLLLLPLAKEITRKPESKADDLLVALILNATACTIVLALWPGANGRYAIPAILPVAAVAGLGFERLRLTKPALIKIVGVLLLLFVSYRVLLNWLVMPLAPDTFGKSRYYGQFIADAVATRPGTVYSSTVSADYNVFVYVPNRMRVVPFETIASMQPPAWAFLWSDEVRRLKELRPDATIIVHIAVERPVGWQLIEIRKKE